MFNFYIKEIFKPDELSKLHPIAKLIFVFTIMFLLYVLMLSIGILLGTLLFDISYSKLSSLLAKDLSEASNRLLKYFQTIQSISLFIIPAIIARKFLLREKQKKHLSFSHMAVLSVLLLIFYLSSSPFLNAIVEWNANLELPNYLEGLESILKKKEEQATNITEKLLLGKSYQSYAINLIIIAIIPALGEELLFRGVFQNIFSEWTKNHHISILITAILFSALHFQFFGFVPRMFLGIYLGYLYFWGKNILLPIIAHFINNAFAVSFYYFKSKSVPQLSETHDALNSTDYLIYSMVISILILWFVRKYLKSAHQ